MELKEISEIVYELTRAKQDRICMEYEDQLSFLQRKYEKLQVLLYTAKSNYVQLTEQVKQLGKASAAATKKENNTNNRVVVSRGNDDGKETAAAVKPVLPSTSASSSSSAVVSNISVRGNIKTASDGKLGSDSSKVSFFQEPPSPKILKTAVNTTLKSTSTNLKQSSDSKPIDSNENSSRKRKSEEINVITTPSPSKMAKSNQNPSHNADLTHVSKYRKPDDIPIGENHSIEAVDEDQPQKGMRKPLLFERSPQNKLRITKTVPAHSTTAALKGPSMIPSSKLGKDSFAYPTSAPSKTSLRREQEAAMVGTTVSSSSSSSRRPAVQSLKAVEVVRKKDERDALRGFQCEECAAFYNAQLQQGILDKEKIHEFLQKCSRHKSKWTPPQTPEGFWDLSVRTPDEWKQQL